jgi:NACHT domain
MATESAFEKKVEEQTASTAFQLVWGWLSDVGNKAWEKNAIRSAMKTYADLYRARHGTVKVLGMSRPAPLHQIYTSVRVVPRDFLGAFTDIDKMHEAFKKAGRQQPVFRSTKNKDGIQVANDEPFLNLLGAPGAGKSTFLRRLGLEALLASPHAKQMDLATANLRGKYKHARLPVYLELRAFRAKPVDLVALITEEFATCQFPESRGFVEAALEKEKMLVLLDGLDEVPNDKLNEVIAHVRGFVDKYGTRRQEGNRFVTSCRTAHYKNAFPRFVDVVLADFSDAQIKQFATNWFADPNHNESNTAEKFVTTINEPVNAGALELARTPLLLTFLCITYDHGQELPPTRATLYRRALDLLLREWAAERTVHNEPVYQELSAELELDMLAEMAESLFREDRFFFNRRHVTDHIRIFLSRELKAPKSLDADRILEAIEVQQGLIVRRAQDAYSFSHLTIQEYLTARKLWDGGEPEWKQAIVDHVVEGRWSVVFELMAGMGKADNLIELIATLGQAELLRDICNNISTRAFLQWIAVNMPERQGLPAQHVAVGRLMALALACVCDSPADVSQKFADCLLQSALEPALLRTRIITPDVSLGQFLTIAGTLCSSRCLHDRGTAGVAQALLQKHDVAQTVASRYLRVLIQNDLLALPPQRLSALTRSLGKDNLDLRGVSRTLLLPKLGSRETFARWAHYVQIIELLLSCKQASYRLSKETWDQACLSVLSLPKSP